MLSEGEGCFAEHHSANEVENSILCIRKLLVGGGMWDGGGVESSAGLHVGLSGSEGVGWEVKERDVLRVTSLQRRWKISSFESRNFLGEEGCCGRWRG